MSADAETKAADIETLLPLIEETPITVALQDCDLVYRRVDNPPGFLAGRDMIGLTDVDMLPPAAAAAVTEAKRHVLQSGERRQLKLPIDAGGEIRHFDLYLSAQRDDRGGIAGVASVLVDVTASRRSSDTLHVLLRELSHRSKNLLAIVQSLAAQTARSANSTSEFIERFNGRIRSVSQSQDLITDTDWRGARLSDLLHRQVEPYVIDAASQVSFAGKDHYLRPNAALYVGLALHELAVNAAKFGAFSTPQGRVSIVAEDTLSTGASDPMLLLSWTEAGGPPPEARPETEFGHALLARLVPASVGGTAERTFLADGMRYQLTLARTEFE